MTKKTAWIVSGFAVALAIGTSPLRASADVKCNDGKKYLSSCDAAGTNGKACVVEKDGLGCCAPGKCMNKVCNLPAAQTACMSHDPCATKTCSTPNQGTADQRWWSKCTDVSIAEGKSCPLNDKCQKGKCVQGACKGEPVNCGDSSLTPAAQCQQKVTACNPLTGCAPVAVADATECDDGNPCTLGERCFKGSCGFGPGKGLFQSITVACQGGHCNGHGQCVKD